MSTSKTYAVAIAFRGHPYGFIVDAPNWQVAQIEAIEQLAIYLDGACAFEDGDEEMINSIISKLRELPEFYGANTLIEEQDFSYLLRVDGAEEVVSLWRHGFECGKLRDAQHALMRERNHWRDRAFKMVRAAKAYKIAYIDTQSEWLDSSARYSDLICEIVQRLKFARILHIGFLAAGIGLGLIIHHLIF